MNTQIKTRGYSAETIAIVHDLLNIALTTPSELADVFVEFSPHVEEVGVRIHPHGWTPIDAPFSGRANVATLCGPAAALRSKLTEYLASLATKTPEGIANEKAASLRKQAQKLIEEADAISASNAQE